VRHRHGSAGHHRLRGGDASPATPIGANLKTLIIAEAGVNHNGDLELALQLVDVAASAGADVVKFQTFAAGRLVTADVAMADYQARSTRSADTQRAMLQRLELTADMHGEIIQRCASRGIEFLSTPFDVESAAQLLALRVRRLKIPSGEITNLPYLRFVGGAHLPIIMSSGMATMEEIGDALAVLTHAGTPLSDITVLHCTTEYPTPMADVNLRAMQTIQETFGVTVGYSDHTQGIEVAAAAVALGATVIEKHFTQDRGLPGPDHQASLEPRELASMVLAIRSIESALGDGIKRPVPGESRNSTVVRKSIVAARAIRAGERFCPENLTVKRPGTGVSPMRWDDVIGRVATRDYRRDELITP
jgi:N,N'-diacetyllegionaminate synthase